MSRISELAIPCLQTPIFGFRPERGLDTAFLARAQVLLDLPGRPQAVISLWERIGVDSGCWTWGGCGHFYLTANEELSEVRLLEWCTLVGGPAEESAVLHADPIDMAEFAFLDLEEKLAAIWARFASILHTAGLITDIDEVDLTEVEQTDDAEYLIAASVGFLDRAALDALVTDARAESSWGSDC